MWPFKFKKWSKVGQAYKEIHIKSFLAVLAPQWIFLRDNEYRAIPLNDFLELGESSHWPDKWIKDVFDCDDQTYAYLTDIKRAWAKKDGVKEALACGYISGIQKDGTHHAIVWQVDNMGSVNLIEPQTGKIYNGKFTRVIFVEG